MPQLTPRELDQMRNSVAMMEDREVIATLREMLSSGQNKTHPDSFQIVIDEINARGITPQMVENRKREKLKLTEDQLRKTIRRVIVETMDPSFVPKLVTLFEDGFPTIGPFPPKFKPSGATAKAGYITWDDPRSFRQMQMLAKSLGVIQVDQRLKKEEREKAVVPPKFRPGSRFAKMDRYKRYGGKPPVYDEERWVFEWTVTDDLLYDALEKSVHQAFGTNGIIQADSASKKIFSNMRWQRCSVYRRA